MNKVNNIESIIFDMDGVMFDTERLYEEAFAMIAKKWGYESEVTEEFIKSLLFVEPLNSLTQVQEIVGNENKVRR